MDWRLVETQVEKAPDALMIPMLVVMALVMIFIVYDRPRTPRR